ncbi:glutathione S-transferase family protein [Acidiphilium acidophilum]|uniref:glutathione S-transferase family protein n=1 Tax=Acidiphilium acidophilum TaxID=76588 RepID=UPI002F266C0D
MQMIKLYDLAGRDETVRFSPFCWRTRLALAHKGLPVETVPWRFTEKDVIAFSGQGLVPVLVDGGRVISDSWAIARYLDDTYADLPRLFANEQARALTAFVNDWTDTVLNPAVRQIILPDIVPLLHDKDRAYFIASREKRFGLKMNAYKEKRDSFLAQASTCLAPLRLVLARQAYLGGGQPSYADHVAMSAFIWSKICSPVRLWSVGDPLAIWFERMFSAHESVMRGARFQW